MRCPLKKINEKWIHQEYKWVNFAKGQAIIDAYNHVQEKFKNKSNVFIHKKNSTDTFLGKGYFDWVYTNNQFVIFKKS